MLEMQSTDLTLDYRMGSSKTNKWFSFLTVRNVESLQKTWHNDFRFDI